MNKKIRKKIQKANRRAEARLGRGLIFGAGAYLLALPVAFGQADSTAEPTTMDKMVVTGSNIPTLEVESIAPVSVLSRQEIDQSPVQNVAGLLRRQPVSNFGGFSGNNNNTTGSDGATSISLRGLGADATLVLMNGRRVTQYGFYGDSLSFVDLNSFPLGFIDSIEILKDGASAIYGADAIGGVVNIKTKRVQNGGEAAITYGNTTRGDDVSQTSGYITFGAVTDKTQVIAGVSYYKQNALYNRDRSFSKSADHSAQGGYPGGSVNNNPGYFQIPTETALSIAPGIVPEGYESSTILVSPGRGSNGLLPPSSWYGGSISDMISNPNVGRYDFNVATIAIPESERYGIYAAGDQVVFEDDKMNLFGDVLYNSATSTTGLAPGPITNFRNEGITVPASNIYNPWGVDISGTSRYRPTEAGPRMNEATTDFLRFVAGLKGTINPHFNYESAFYWNESRTLEVGSYVSRSLFNDLLARPGADAYNPFASSQSEFEANRTIISDAQVLTNTRWSTKLYGADAKLNGTIVNLPGGDLQYAAGYEYRKERFERYPDAFLGSGDLIGFFATEPEPPSGGSRDVHSGYAEVRIPIFGQDLTFPGAHSFVIDAAGRYEDYSDLGDTAVPKIGGRWQPIDDSFTIRGSWQEGFKAPSLMQVDPSLFNQGGVLLTDSIGPSAGTQLETTVVTTGNPNLEPEDAESWTAGIVLTPKWGPKWVQGFTVSFDWWNVIRDQITGAPNWQGIIDENPLDPRIIRDEVTQEIIYIQSPLTGSGKIEARGFDWEMRYDLQTENCGSFELGFGGTYIDSYKLQIDANSGFNEVIRQSVSSTGASDAYLQWQFVGSLFWYYRNLELGVTANYLDGYRDVEDWGPEEGVTGSYRRVENYYTVDLQATYKGPWQTRWTVGVNNVTDNDPPFSAGADMAEGYITQLYNPIGRFIYATITKRF